MYFLGRQWCGHINAMSWTVETMEQAVNEMRINKTLLHMAARQYNIETPFTKRHEGTGEAWLFPVHVK